VFVYRDKLDRWASLRPGNATVSTAVNDVGGGARPVDLCNYDNDLAQLVVESAQSSGNAHGLS
jgi:hypothetical protein